MSQTRTYDAANRNVAMVARYRQYAGSNRSSQPPFIQMTEYYGHEFDGDGHDIEQLWGMEVSGPTLSVYQIWSSALAGFVTAAGPDGEKMKTNVYAGGTVIAEQLAPGAGDHVVWMHTDPVTGSTEGRIKAGTQYGMTEYEPLGQVIDPTGAWTPPPNSIEFGGNTVSADNPHSWCQLETAMSTSFWNLSASCQIAHLERNPLFNPYAKEDKKDDLSNLNDGPPIPADYFPRYRDIRRCSRLCSECDRQEKRT